MLFAVVQLVSQTDLQSKVTQVSASVMKHIIRPMHKEINRKK
jgi:hypothetical protein